jgi:hypothetical protein
MSRQTGIPDWVCWTHSSAGYAEDGGCDECAKEKAKATELQSLREEVARLGGVVDRLHGVLSRMNARNDLELAKKDESISQLQGTIDQLRLERSERLERDL